MKTILKEEIMVHFINFIINNLQIKIWTNTFQMMIPLQIQIISKKDTRWIIYNLNFKWFGLKYYKKIIKIYKVKHKIL